MHTWVNQFRQQMDNHVKGGGKESRRNEVRKINYFLRWVSAHTQANTPHGIGDKQVLEFYRAHAHRSDRTLSDYWYAIRSIWKWLGRTGIPPRPPIRLEICRPEETIQYERFSARVGRLVLAGRIRLGMSVADLAAASGFDVRRISRLESGHGASATLGQCEKIFTALRLDLNTAFMSTANVNMESVENTK